MTPPTFDLYLAAVERVKQKLQRATAALDAAGIPYAVIGGNAVAAWVADKDPTAVRTTQDVDVMLRRPDEQRAIKAMEEVGFIANRVRRFLIFTERDDPNRRTGVHVIFAGERLWPSYPHETPDVAGAVRSAEGFLVLDLESLLKMKLTSFRDRDRAHIRDLLSVGAITPEWSDRLPADLRARLEQILATPEEPEWLEDDTP